MTTTMRAIVGVLVLLLGLGVSGTVSAATAQFSEEDALQYGAAIGIDWATAPFDAAQFAAGMNVELEHGARDAQTDVTGDDPTATAKIAYAHLKELPDYYYRLYIMEKEGDAAAAGVALVL